MSFQGLKLAGVGMVAAGALSLVQCGGPMVAGTSEPARAACRILYGDFAVGDAHMFRGACIVPRPRVSLATRETCAQAVATAWGWAISPNPGQLCDV